MTKNRVPEFPYLLAEWLDQIPRQQRLAPIYLGGTGGSGGGAGQPPGGFVGKLPQRYVAYDTDQFALTSGSASLVDNLNHIRFWEKPARWFEAHQGTPIQNRVYVEAGIWHNSNNVQPLIFTGSYSPVFTSGSVPHVDVLYLTTSGSLAWSTSVTTTPSYPAGTVLPIYEVYIRSSGNTYDTDQGTNNYLLRDVRPFLNVGASGSSSGSLNGTPTRIPYFNTSSTLGDHGQFNLTFDTSGSPILVVGSNRNLFDIGVSARIQVISEVAGAGFTAYSFNDTPTLSGFYALAHARGTRVSPTPILSGDSLGRNNYLGWITSGSAGFATTSARMEALAQENFTTGSQGTYFSFSVTKPATATLVEAFNIKYDRATFKNATPLVGSSILIQHTDNTSLLNNSKLVLEVAGSAGGSPFISLDISGVSTLSLGVDNADSDTFKITDNSGITSGTLLSLTRVGQLAIPTSGSVAGVLLGGDTLLYRMSADLFRTPDSLTVDSGFNLGSASNAPVGQLRQSSGSQIWNGVILSAITGGAVVVGSGAAQRLTLWNGTNDVSSSANATFDGNQLALASSGSTGGILIGADTQIYRKSADLLVIPDNVQIDRGINLGTATGATVGSLKQSSGSQAWANIALTAVNAGEITVNHSSPLNTVIPVADATSGLVYISGFTYDGNANLSLGGTSGVAGTGSGIAAGSGNVLWYNSASDVWRTPDSVTIDGSLTVTTGSGNVKSGTYTPTLTNTTNITSSTAEVSQYMRVQNVVTVSGRVTIQSTAAGGVVMGLSLPIASAIANLREVCGTAQAAGQTFNVEIRGDSVNDRATVAYTAATGSSISFYYHFTYLLL